jgi:hypothetical protein
MEIVMSGNINTFFAGTTSNALAMGGQTATSTAGTTAAWPGLSAAYAAAVAVAQNNAPVMPHTSADTDATATGGYITSSNSVHWSVDFPYGPTPVSVDVSISTVSSYGGGDALSGYGLQSPSLHGLF